MKKNKLKFYTDLLRKSSLNRAFTLIELMVATSIFVVIMLVALGSLVTTSDAAKKAQALNFTMDNLSFAMESMSRSMRMGTQYYCTNDSLVLSGDGSQDCETGSTGVSFVPGGGDSSNRMGYKLTLDNETENYKIQRCTGDDGCVDIIANNINIETLKFFVRGTPDYDLVQPNIFMIIKGTVYVKNEYISFAMQTMISQRTSE